MADVVLKVDTPQKSVNPNHLTQVLKQLLGVTAVSIDAGMSQAAVSYDTEKVDTFELVTAVQDAGYIVQTQSILLLVGGMTCASCAFHVESALTDIPGVIKADVNLQTGETAVTIASELVTLAMLRQAVEEIGYQISEVVIKKEKESWQSIQFVEWK
jgi:Cu+-exporting ATPase